MSVAVPSSSHPRAVSDTVPATYLQRLGARTERVGTWLCVGLDPDPQALPKGFAPNVNGIEAFAGLLVSAASPYAAAFKANLAFFEAFGSAGVAALERVRAQIPPDIPFIADAKRGDISTTAARQEAAIFGALGSDAVTLNPYLGLDAIAPFLERSDRFVYVLCRTSNPGAAEIQALPGDDGQPLFRRVAQTIAGWTVDGRDRIGLVVGATASAELAQVRDIAPALPFLVPGVGAQGGDVDAVRANGGVRGGPASTLAGRGLLVNVSRGIASAALGVDDPEAAIRRSAEHWAVQLRA